MYLFKFSTRYQHHTFHCLLSAEVCDAQVMNLNNHTISYNKLVVIIPINLTVPVGTTGETLPANLIWIHISLLLLDVVGTIM